MSGKCSIAKCTHPSHVLCHGCQANFCREHLFEHSNSIILQLNPLIDQVNQFDDDSQQIDPANLLQTSYQRLEEWRQQTHHIVDVYFTEKVQELDDFIQKKLKQYQQDLHDVQQTIVVYKREQETTHEQINKLTYQVENLRKTFNDIKLNDMYMQLNTLTLQRDLIKFERSLNVSTLPPNYQRIDRTETCCFPLATNKELLLLHHVDTLLVVDKKSSIHRQTPWTNGSILDMCYSSALDRFIIINENEVFLFHEKKMKIEKVRSVPWQRYISCTCSEMLLYLVTRVYNSSLLQFSLKPKIEFVRKWPPSTVCNNDESIDGIVYNSNTLALMISKPEEKRIRLELKSTVTFNKIWSLPLDIIYDNSIFRFCLINSNQWLVVDHKNTRLLQITKDGKLKTVSAYQPTPFCAIEFGDNVLAIVTTLAVNLHKFA